MLTKELEPRGIIIGGFPQIIPAELTPEAVYEEEGIGENITDRIKYWKQIYSGEKDFSTHNYGSLEQELACLEDYYMQGIALSD